MLVNVSRSLCAVALISVAFFARAQTKPAAPTPPPTLRKATDLIRKQEPLKVNQALLKPATPDNVHIIVSIPKQRAYLMMGEEIVADAPVSSGKRGHESPRGHMRVLEEGPNHHSSLYGDLVDRSGRVVRGGVRGRIVYAT